MISRMGSFYLYLGLRLRCLTYQLREFSRQIRQFLMWSAVFLGPAVLALSFGLLLVVGQLYNPDLSAAEWSLVGWSLLSSQALLVWICRNAILQPRYQLFFNTLNCQVRAYRLANLLLLSCCVPVCWLHLLVIAGANHSQWQSALPQLIFWGLQLISAVQVLDRPKRSVLGLLLALPVLAWVSNLWQGLLLFSLVIILPPFMPCRKASLPLLSRNACCLWLKLNAHQPEQWLSRLLLLALVTILGQITLTQRPDMAVTVNFVCAAVLMLISSSMQLNNNRLSQHYALFFRQFAASSHYWQYLAPMLLAGIALGLLLYLQAASWLLLIACVQFIACWSLARYYPQQWICGWLLLNSGLAIWIAAYWQ